MGHRGGTAARRPGLRWAAWWRNGRSGAWEDPGTPGSRSQIQACHCVTEETVFVCQGEEDRVANAVGPSQRQQGGGSFVPDCWPLVLRDETSPPSYRTRLIVVTTWSVTYSMCFSKKTPRCTHTPTLHACQEPQTPTGPQRNSPDTTSKHPSAEHSVGVWNARVLRDVCSDNNAVFSAPPRGGDVPEWATLRDAQVVSSSAQAGVSTFRGPRSLITHIHQGLCG